MNLGIHGFPRGQRGKLHYSPDTFTGCKYVRTSVFNIPSANVLAYVPWQAARYDTHNFCDLVNNPTRLVMPFDGWYEIGVAAYVDTASAGSDSRVVFDYGSQLGGSAVKRLAMERGASVKNFRSSVSTVARFAASDFVELGVISSGGTRRINNATATDDWWGAFFCWRVG